MKIFIIILILILSFALKSQVKYLIDYNKNCNAFQFEDMYRFLTHVNSYCLEYNLLSIDLTTVMNCGEADTIFFNYSKDTLFLNTEQLPRISISDGDTTYLNGIVDCDCPFNLNFDIYGFSKIPTSIYFNGEPIILNNIKYKKRETIEHNGFSEVLYDDCGYNYKVIYNEDQKITKVHRMQGLKHQVLIFDENRKITEIRTIKNSIDNISIIKIK
jgi:hypothetical protein